MTKLAKRTAGLLVDNSDGDSAAKAATLCTLAAVAMPAAGPSAHSLCDDTAVATTTDTAVATTTDTAVVTTTDTAVASTTNTHCCGYLCSY